MGNTATTKKGDSTESGKFFYFVAPDVIETIRQVANGQHCQKYLQ